MENKSASINVSWTDEGDDSSPLVNSAPLKDVWCRGIMFCSSSPSSFHGDGFEDFGAVTFEDSSIPKFSKDSTSQISSSATAVERPKIAELIEWSHKKGKMLQWNVWKVCASGGGSNYSASVTIVSVDNEEFTCKGTGSTKKIAKQAAANAAFYRLFPTTETSSSSPRTAIVCNSLEQAVGWTNGDNLFIPRVLYACPARHIIRDLIPQHSTADSEKKTVEARLRQFPLKAYDANYSRLDEPKNNSPYCHENPKLIDYLNKKFKAIERSVWGGGMATNEEPVLPRDLPFVARLDGRNFTNKFKKGTLVSKDVFRKPYDQRLHGAFCAAAADCLTQFPSAAVAYTQSDEITIVFLPQKSSNDQQVNQHPCQGRVGKLVSLLAATVSVSFNRYLARMCLAEANSNEKVSFNDDTTSNNESFTSDSLIFENGISEVMFLFDCRVFSVASEAEAVECCMWRCVDARRNSVSMMYYHWEKQNNIKSDAGKKTSTQIMLRALAQEGGISWLDTPDALRHGSWIFPTSRICRANSSGGILAGVFQMPEVSLPVSDDFVDTVLHSTLQ